MKSIDFRQEAASLDAQLVAWRRDFHMHPELGFEEFRTSAIVADELHRLGMEVQTGVGRTGVVGILEGSKDGPTVLIRADMDALPIDEENQAPYASQVRGKMHACGHDGHTSIVLGVARVLSQHREQLAGRIKFVFQPAEELAGGAVAMVKDGVMTNPRPDVSLGLHLWNGMALGKLSAADGPVMAGSSEFTITIRGKGGHGASPHLTHDPVICSAHIITALQTVVSRNVNPLESGVISVTQMNAGTAMNVIPQHVTLRGTLRAFTMEVRDVLEERMKAIAGGVAGAMNCSAEVHVEHATLPVTNEAVATARARSAFARALPDIEIDASERTMGAEDVGVFMDDVPGTYFFLGAALPNLDAYYGHHHPRFDFDEAALPMGVALLAAAAADYVLP